MLFCRAAVAHGYEVTAAAHGFDVLSAGDEVAPREEEAVFAHYAHYSTLGVARNASLGQIEAAFDSKPRFSVRRQY